jgi:D-threo-aldose 1-dehydrogenase
VTPSSVPHPVEKLALRVVDAPAGNGAQAPGAREDAMRLLLQTAADAGVKQVASRPAGDGERLLGQAWPFPSPFRVTVRTVSLEEGLDRVEARARRSLERMGLPRGEALIVSNAADLAGAEGRALWNRLNGLKDRGLFRRIGFRATVEDGPALMARRLSPDIVETPCNLLDQRAVSSGALEELASLGVEVHVSSVFARGLLFAERHTLPPHLTGMGVALSRARRMLAEARLDPMQAALAFALGRPEVTSVVASVASAAELRALLAAAHAPTGVLDFSRLALPEPAMLTASPGLSRVSSAA